MPQYRATYRNGRRVVVSADPTIPGDTVRVTGAGGIAFDIARPLFEHAYKRVRSEAAGDEDDVPSP